MVLISGRAILQGKLQPNTKSKANPVCFFTIDACVIVLNVTEMNEHCAVEENHHPQPKTLSTERLKVFHMSALRSLELDKDAPVTHKNQYLFIKHKREQE
ncbi:hypothetical protein AMECASPLE_015489 [Ameca splendens]|uniref:Uncharacterized protein n=1 Tax=Ameca splendens TaxID=208324 RepID=A0ABV1A9Y3_9TELE